MQQSVNGVRVDFLRSGKNGCRVRRLCLSLTNVFPGLMQPIILDALDYAGVRYTNGRVLVWQRYARQILLKRLTVESIKMHAH